MEVNILFRYSLLKNYFHMSCEQQDGRVNIFSDSLQPIKLQTNFMSKIKQLQLSPYSKTSRKSKIQKKSKSKLDSKKESKNKSKKKIN